MMAGSSWCLLFLYLCQNLTLARTEEHGGDVRPLHYKLHLLTKVDSAKQEGRFNGEVTIQLRVWRETSSIILSSDGLKVDPEILLIRKNTNGQVAVKRAYLIISQRRLVVDFKTPLWLGEEYSLIVKFSRRFERTPQGYFLAGEGEQWLTLTELAPNLAGSVFPCFENASLVTPIELSLAHRREMQALSNMPVRGISRHAPIYRKDYMLTNFVQSPPMSPHQLVFSVNSLKKQGSPAKVNANNPSLVFWLGSGIEEGEGGYAMNLSSQLIFYIADLYGVPYPLEKIDVMALPDGVYQSPSYLGLLGVPESSFLYSEQNSTLVAKQEVTSRLAQVLTHHWLANLISSDLAWLADGLSDYIASFAVDIVEPDWRLHEVTMIRKAFLVLEEDSRASSRPLSFSQSLGAETTASRKMVLLFRMLHSLVGTQVFVTSFQAYLKRKPKEGSNRTLLWEIFQSESNSQMSLPPDIPIQQLMSSWTMQPGYPVLRVIRNYDSGRVTVSQQRFLRNPRGGKGTSNRRRCWWVPLTFTTAKEHNFQQTNPAEWLRCGVHQATHSQELTDVAPQEEWLLFNLHLTTPCRVAYDERNWRLLDEELGGSSNRLDGFSRAQILDDALSLATAGLVTYDLAFGFLRHLQYEDEVIVWQAAAINLEWLYRHLQNTPIIFVFKGFIRSLLESKFSQLFPEPEEAPKESETEDTESSGTKDLKRIVLQLSCQTDLGSCEKLAQREFSGLTDNTNQIPMDLRGILYCTAIRLGTEADWILLRKIYKTSKDSGERSIILASLACSPDNWALENMLQWVFTSRNMSKEDVLRVFSAVVQSPLGYSLAKDYLVNNIQRIKKFYNHSTEELSQLLTALMEEIYTDAELDFIWKFIRTQLKDLPGIESTSRRLRELGQDNIAWHKDHYQHVVAAVCNISESLEPQCI